ncbi:transposase [Xylocopilactobacillus apis]|uniref:Insertion element IS150 protein InsJ-like helix-turn-helix domain-containing protein n=1 Tax=Xylocopilactobacillus apis TaxID=2932183 RepID=A0AAU9CTR2_9LACO|nr:hypothetical protein KIMC2_02930 [Xylocopilactobacillus apis]
MVRRASSSPEVRLGVVARVLGGCPVAVAARESGYGEGAVQQWVRRYREEHGGLDMGEGDGRAGKDKAGGDKAGGDAGRVAELEGQVAELRMQVDVLREAVGLIKKGPGGPTAPTWARSARRCPTCSTVTSMPRGRARSWPAT